MTAETANMMSARYQKIEIKQIFDMVTSSKNAIFALMKLKLFDEVNNTFENTVTELKSFIEKSEEVK